MTTEHTEADLVHAANLYEEHWDGAQALIERAIEVSDSPIFERVWGDMEFQVALSRACGLALGESQQPMVIELNRVVIALVIARLES